MAEIRPASEREIADIVEVVNSAFQVESGFRIGSRTSMEEIKRLVSSREVLVAIEEQEMAGAVMVRVRGTTGYFGMLVVRPTLQRSGLGRALLEAAENFCRAHGCTVMTLSTGSVRRELIERYRKLGYEVTAVEPPPQGGPFTKEIEIVKMAKRL